jgi:glycerol-3-phosphate dehydrogenase
LIRENPDYGEIVCRCEQISRGEVIDALHRSIPCDTLDGVKRRVRPGMGRCQGGFCGPLVLKIIAQETGKSQEEIAKSAPGGELLYGNIKEVSIQ